MATQRRNLRRPKGSDKGAHWISYSDMMASLLLVFVLAVCYSIFQYYDMLAIKTQQLDVQQKELDKAQITLVDREKELETANVTLMGKQEELSQIQIQLDKQKQDLNAAQISIGEKEAQLQEEKDKQEVLQSTLEDQALKLGALQSLLDAQKTELNSQQERIDDLVGVRSQIIKELSVALSKANLKATVDDTTGDIRLESQVFFETGSFKIKESGQNLLNRFLPVYMSVLMRDEYKEYVGEIIIEGHTDTAGSYISNLELSQNRALAVSKYCLQMPSISGNARLRLQEILTAKGRSYSDLVYDQNGKEDMEASRRVEFKFRLKDAEMIAEMDKILKTIE